MVEPAGAGLVASAPPDPVQVVGFGLQAAGDQQEQAFDLGDGQGDQTEILRWLRVGCAFHVELAPGRSMRADAAVATYLAGSRHQRRWQVCSVTGSTGERAYAWAWIATTSPRHFLLIRKTSQDR